ncbi:MAG: hypothetical protein MUP13_13155 [Thermoanaerobaculales bacterium]|nr:hypothetical protein [Thermoanaerobaculales bacterium]
MNDRDPTTEAYQILADLLVTIRRVIHRGLEKVSGKTWYLDGCPPGHFEQLVERKEKEKAIDRFSGEYQELITFASLDELAEIIEYNGDLTKLLASLEPEGSPMIDRLREIEALRLKMAASVPFDDGDLEAITRYHREFRDSLTRRKRAPEEVTPPPEASEVEEDVQEEPPRDDTTADDVEEALDSNGELAAVGRAKDFNTQVATFEELVEFAGGMKPVPEPDEPPNDDEFLADIESSADLPVLPPGDLDNADLVIEVELAMAEDDDRGVLRVLHREVTGIAESAFRKILDLGHPVWDTVRSSGWYDMKKADLALAPLELFYTVVARAADVQRSGAGFEAVKASLDEAQFSKLLLSLREMFLRQSL